LRTTRPLKQILCRLMAEKTSVRKCSWVHGTKGTTNLGTSWAHQMATVRQSARWPCYQQGGVLMGRLSITITYVSRLSLTIAMNDASGLSSQI
jgi:hypothetical protein